MIRHIVMFKIKDEYKDEIPQLVKNFYGMKGRIEGMLELEAGADILHSERSYDLALVTLFENREAIVHLIKNAVLEGLPYHERYK